jgi:hypothetical protein
MSLDRVLSHADFSGRVGEECVVEAGEHRVPLLLDAAEEVPGSQREGGGFRLQFIGSVEQMLGQGIHIFRFGEQEYELFIVPLGRDRRGAHYEALFY